MFCEMEQAESLAAANKRIANILRKAEVNDPGSVSATLLSEDAENELYAALQATESEVLPLLKDSKYTDALKQLAGLRDSVDRFFDDVMVMADDEAVRNNRLALLASLRRLFSGVADISRLSVS